MLKLSPVLISLILLVINQTEAQIQLNKNNLATLCNCNSPNSQTVQIDLQNKSIASIDPNTFVGLTAIQYLRLNNNLLTTIDLYLNNNKLTSFDSLTLRGMKSLRYISLANNQLTSIHPDTFNCLTYLGMIALSNNKLTDIQPGTLKDLSSYLHSIYLMNNLLTTIRPGTFQGCSYYERIMVIEIIYQ